MDPVRIGQSLRALRIRLNHRQIDVASRAGVSRGTISAIERGMSAGVSFETLTGVAIALGATLDVRVRWRGAELDRLLDEGHARLVAHLAHRLTRLNWIVDVEATFSINWERGSIDLLAFHPATATLLVVEVKTVVPDFQSLVATLDTKTRLARRIAADRGRQAHRVGRLVVIEDVTTARDRVRRIDGAARAAFPDRGATVRAWLREPSGSLSGLLFVRTASQTGVANRRTGRQRVRRSSMRRSAIVTSVPAPSSRPASDGPA